MTRLIIKYTSIVLVTYAFMGCAGIKHTHSKSSSSQPIGTIITSVLDFNDFSIEVGNNIKDGFDPKTSKWAPADGRDVTGSTFQTKFDVIVPDLRGQFLRGLNQFYSPNEPDEFLNGKDQGQRSNVLIYSYQSQSTSLPNNNFTLKDSYVNDKFVYSFNAGNYRSTRHENLNQTRNVPFNNTWSSLTETGEGGGGNNQYGLRLLGKTEKRAFNPVVYGGDSETRPKNIGVYYYIKIND